MESNLSLFYGLSFLTAAIAFLFALYLYLWVKFRISALRRCQSS